jgi:CDP-paratose 2-epimerase
MTSVLITGGSGFIGINLADRLIGSGAKVHIFDNLSRGNVVRNLTWLLRKHGGDSAQVTIADTRDRAAVRKAVRGVDQVFHFAAQVAVTSSIEDPKTDFDINVIGTLNILEECRALSRPPSLLYTSTNKVYGALPRLRLVLEDERYRCADGVDSGIDENTPLDFHSPYGCSKGAAEQYVMDYHRTFGLPMTVFRMSCIYGAHQFGTEDQGWVAHIISQAIMGKPITIYGDGCQVRDVLYVDDLIDAMLLAQANIKRIAGMAFNIGGGPESTLSILELLDMLRARGTRPTTRYSNWRPGDQKYYVSDIRKFENVTGWRPRIAAHDGIGLLHEWLLDSMAVREQTVLQPAS